MNFNQVDTYPDHTLQRSNMDDDHFLQNEYRNSFPQKLETLRSDIENLRKYKSLEMLSKFRFDVHKLAGSLGTYGFLKASHLCRTLDVQLQERILNFTQEKFENSFFEKIKLFMIELELALKVPDVEVQL